jgi:hypothetical protein
MDENVVLEAFRTSQRVFPCKQGWTANGEKRIAQQEGGIEP